MPHGIWKGDISFGLIYIPVILYSAESHQCDVKLKLLDKRDLSPIGYQKINKTTGEKISADKIVEAYEYEKGSYVLLTKEEIKKFHTPSDQSIELVEFVDRTAIEPEYYEKPYYLEPYGKGERGYVLLREALQKTKKIGIAKVTIRTRRYLAALSVEKNAILLELLRFPCELLPQSNFNFPATTKKPSVVQKKELQIAEQLVKNMSAKWEPAKYKNEYQGSLMDYIAEKIRLGESHPIKEEKIKVKSERKGEIIDIMHLLKKSIEQKGRAKTKTATDAKRSKGRKKTGS